MLRELISHTYIEYGLMNLWSEPSAWEEGMFYRCSCCSDRWVWTRWGWRNRECRQWLGRDPRAALIFRPRWTLQSLWSQRIDYHYLGLLFNWMFDIVPDIDCSNFHDNNCLHSDYYQRHNVCMQLAGLLGTVYLSLKCIGGPRTETSGLFTWNMCKDRCSSRCGTRWNLMNEMQPVASPERV